jgi:hypothetical protein
MTSERIKELQLETAYPDSLSVKTALLQVWNECEQELRKELYSDSDMTDYALYILNNDVITPREWFERFKK